MNPPPALFGAMNRERKPFTYTPGGLDLSEIKSERMAKRLMRNAMNQGVPDTPVQSVKSPPASNIPVAIPNFNCLPVQVFPTFQLPANPKSLLRTRSNPDGSSEPNYKSTLQSVDTNKSISSSTNTNRPCLIPASKTFNNKVSLVNNISEEPKNSNNCSWTHVNNGLENGKNVKSQLNFEERKSFINPPQDEQLTNKAEKYNSLLLCSDELNHRSPLNVVVPNSNKTDLLLNYNDENINANSYHITNDHCNDSIILPEISYEAEYLTTIPEKTQQLSGISYINVENNRLSPLVEASKRQLSELNVHINSKEDKQDIETVLNNNVSILQKEDFENCNNTPLSPEIYYEAETIIPENEINMSKSTDKISSSILPNFDQSKINEKQNRDVLIDDSSNKHEQKEVKTVKKQSEKKVTENEVKSQNGDTEAELVVKLPPKKSQAKTETQVEVEKKLLPNGTIEEITKTITKTTIDGRTETKITTATKTIPKEEVTEEEYEEEEEDAEEDCEEVVANNNKNVQAEGTTDQKEIETETLNQKKVVEENAIKDDHLVTKEVKSETSTTKKVVVTQSESQDSEEEIVEEEEEVIEEESEIEPDVEEVVVIKSKTESVAVEKSKKEEVNEEVSKDANKISQPENESESEIENELEQEQKTDDAKENQECEKNKDLTSENDKEEEDEEIDEETEEIDDNSKENIADSISTTKKEITKDEEEEEKEEITEQEKEVDEDEEEVEESFEEAEDKEVLVEESQKVSDEKNIPETDVKKEENIEKIIPIQQERKIEEIDNSRVTEEISPRPQSILKDVLREPSVPLEKVEEVEIKPIGPTQEIIKKSHTEIITTKMDKPSGALSTQTEYNVVENVVTVNRTTKTLDHSYGQAPVEHSVPITRSYIPPYETSTQPHSKTYQPNYPTQSETDRRHSLLLDRISMERQIPVDIYQNNLYNNNQSYQETQYLFEPQSEVLTESNVKPSTISKNQQWYQQTKKDTFTSNNVSTTPTYEWTPPHQQSIPNLHNQPQSQPQPHPQQQHQPIYQPQYTPKPQSQSSYIDNSARDSYKTVVDKQNVSSYTSKPTWVNSTYDPKPTLPPQTSQYSTFENQSTETYQKSTQQYNSSYVPPPWEQDTGYMAENKNQNIYQPPPLNTFTPTPTQTSWQPNPELERNPGIKDGSVLS